MAKTSHRVADLFAISDRGYLRESYRADVILIKPEPRGFFRLQTTGPVSMQLDTLRRTVLP